jgi:hypothetical protein
MEQRMLPVVGVWQRAYEQDPIGDEEGADVSTLVLWTQTPSGMYVDIRIPEHSPGRRCQQHDDYANIPRRPAAILARGYGEEAKKYILSSSSVKSDLDPRKDPNSMLGVILRQKSFAGFLEYSDSDTTDGTALKNDPVLRTFAAENNEIGLCTCFWKRDIDYQPPSGSLDVGVCASEKESNPESSSSLLLRETGKDGDYAEGWLRLPGTAIKQSMESNAITMALQLISEDNVPRSGYWVRVNNRFAYAVGYPKSEELAEQLECLKTSAIIPTTEGRNLAQLLQDYEPNDILDIVGCYVGITGTIDQENQSWTIQYSTQPELVGCQLLVSGEEKGDDCCTSLLSQNENDSVIEQRLVSASGKAFYRTWRIVELTDGALPLD